MIAALVIWFSRTYILPMIKKRNVRINDNKICRRAVLLMLFICFNHFVFGLSTQIVPKKLMNTLWVQQAYDRILKINDSTYSYYNIDQIGCKPLVEGLFHERFKVISVKKNELVLNPGGIVDYKFTPLNSLPTSCQISPKLNKSYQVNFKVFWETFQNNYAFFKERKINWNLVYEQYLPIVEHVKSDLEFAAMLREIIGKIGDGHIRLKLPDTLKEMSKPRAGMQTVRSKKNLLSDLTKTYIPQIKSYNGGVLQWGYLKNTKTGYILVTDMDTFANYVPEDEQFSASFAAYYNNISNTKSALKILKDEVEGADLIMTQVVQDFANADSLVVDLRFNGGGYETVALKILSFLINHKKKVISISAKKDPGDTDIQEYFLSPSKNNLALPVNVLISPQTASAAEIFALASISYSNVKRIGSKSSGIFSEILWKELPNGWTFGLSNEIYKDAFGHLYEGKGIPVNVELNYSRNRSEFYESFYQDLLFHDQALENILRKSQEQ